MHVRWIAASLFVAFADVAYGQSAAVLGKGDGAFAQALYRRGYPDLAESLCAVIEKSGTVAADEAVMIKALHLDLRLDLAMRETDLAKRRDLLTQILQEKEQFVESYGGRKEADDTSNTLPDVYQKLGDTIVAAIQKEKDPAAVAKLQEDGKKTYAQAVEKLRQRLAELEDGKDDPAKIDRYVSTLFNLPKTLYFYSLLYAKDDKFNRDQKLEEAITGFQVLGLDYSDLPIAYEGLIFEGLCHKELDNTTDALAAFDEVIGIAEQFYTPDNKGYYTLAEIEADLIASATQQKMILLIELKRAQEAADAGKKFYDTINGASETRAGLAVLALRAEALLSLGDTRGASDVADKLVELDGRGPWGAKGREIQGRLIGSGGALDPEKALRIAQTTSERGDKDKALQIAQQAIDAAKGHAKEAELTVEAYLFIANVCLDRNATHEAALVYDTAAERYPNAEKAPEAVYGALRAYSTLNREDKRPYWKKRVDERQKLLVSRYSNSPRAAVAQLFEGQELEDEKNWIGAAEIYAKVQPSSKAYLDAQYRAGRAYFRHSNGLYQQNKAAEAKPFAEQGRALLESVIKTATEERAKTVNLEEQARFDNLVTGAITELAQLLMTSGYDQHAQVLKLLEGTDERFASNPDVISSFWGFRIKALQALGRFDEAVAMLDGLAKKDPDSKAIGQASFLVAVALDKRSGELRASGKADEADAMQKRSATYYQMAGRALLRSDNPKVAQVESVGNRLFALGLDANDVPETQNTFVGWKKPVRDPSNWQIAADLFEAALRISPNSKMQVTLGRTYGFLRQFDKAAEKYGGIFDQEQLFDAKGGLNRNLVRSKPELLLAYFEWGAAELANAQAAQDQDRYRLATTIFDNLLKSKVFEDASSNWWWAKYLQLKTLFDMGNYDNAAAVLREVERSTEGFGEPFGLKADFEKLKSDLAEKK